MANSLFGNQPNNQMNNNDPYKMLQMLAKTNPQVSNVLNILNSGNMSAKDLFIQQAKQMGVNPQDILSMFK